MKTHSHANLSVLEDLTDSGGSLLYNGSPISSQAWSTVTGTPTTLAGYGIADAITAAAAAAAYQPLSAALTTIGGNGSAFYLARANHTGTQAWSTLTGTPTTLAGYGIMDAVPYDGAAGTPSSITLTNGSGTAANLTAGQATASLGIKTATTTVAVSSATAPTSGQVLTATSSTAATWQTPSGGGGSGSQAPLTTLIGLSGGKFVGGNAGTGTGTIDLYTVPSGKRLFVTNVDAKNATAGTITGTVTHLVYVAGAYRQTFTTAASVAANATVTFTHGIVLEAGEKLAISVGTTGLSIFWKGVLYEDTVRLFSPRLTTVAVGDNTLYTVPSGYTAMPTTAAIGITGHILLSNAPGGSSITYKLSWVPSGDTPGSHHFFTSAAGNSLASGTVSNVGGNQLGLEAGDVVIYNTNSAVGQFVWCNVLEVPE